MTSPAAPVFHETQWFARRWWWLLLPASLLMAGLGGYSLAEAPSLPAALSLAGGLLPILAVLWLMRLEVQVDAVGIHYRFFPLPWRWRHWPWAEFRRVFVRTYSPGAYGGWGIRGLPGDLVYNVWGTHGLQLVFASGNHLLLGTQRPAELRATLLRLHAADAALPLRLPASER